MKISRNKLDWHEFFQHCIIHSIHPICQYNFFSLLSMMLELASFLSVVLGLTIPALSLKKFPFGGAVVTSIGMMGIRDAFAPFPRIAFFKDKLS